MDRITFEGLRDLPGKKIEADIRFSKRTALAPVLVAEGIRIDNEHGVELVLNIQFNPMPRARGRPGASTSRSLAQALA